jgi:hypothetical protein
MGNYVERRESTNTNYNISDKPMSKDELDEPTGWRPQDEHCRGV